MRSGSSETQNKAIQILYVKDHVPKQLFKIKFLARHRTLGRSDSHCNHLEPSYIILYLASIHIGSTIVLHIGSSKLYVLHIGSTKFFQKNQKWVSDTGIFFPLLFLWSAD